ncbi:hypothetical protein K438DRAFT_2164966 [Mycena galopus ATCC 62051]|nr:hypothetical protein K438DRAFT_2164966 [Mycena galopus ATCC 62051]
MAVWHKGFGGDNDSVLGHTFGLATFTAKLLIGHNINDAETAFLGMWTVVAPTVGTWREVQVLVVPVCSAALLCDTNIMHEPHPVYAELKLLHPRDKIRICIRGIVQFSVVFSWSCFQFWRRKGTILEERGRLGFPVAFFAGGGFVRSWGAGDKTRRAREEEDGERGEFGEARDKARERLFLASETDMAPALPSTHSRLHFPRSHFDFSFAYGDKTRGERGRSFPLPDGRFPPE